MKKKNGTKSKKVKKISYRKITGIRVKLIGAFLIPVVLIIVLGVLSTDKASRAVIDNYKEATKNTIQKTSEYYTVLFQNADAKSSELSNDGIIRSYYGGTYAGDNVRESDTYDQIRSKIRAAGENDPNIGGVYLMSSYGKSVSTVGNITPDSYDKFMETEEGKKISESGDSGFWNGKHQFVDALTGTEESSYGLTISRQIIGNTMKPIGVIVIDIKRESIQKALATIDLPEGSMCAFVTGDGREITADGENTERVFSGLDLYKAELEGKENTQLRELVHNDSDYIYIYAPVGSSGCTINALIPMDMVTAQADGIKNLTYMIVIIAIIIAVGVGMLLAVGIGNAISHMNKVVEKAAEGDLTVSVRTKRRDEFSVLAKYLENMFAGMKALVERAANVSGKILNSAQKVSTALEQMVDTSKEISQVIEKMEDGMERQATDAKKCLQKMETLEEKIERVSEETAHIVQFTDDTKVIVEKGILAVEELDEKAKETSQITKTVITDIHDLSIKMTEIDKFTNTINNIAKQTNLLSLNASIEAARAGESGRGFSVVANEIRKLAEDSMHASGEIEDIVKRIGSMTEQTAATAKKAEDIVDGQAMALKNTVQTFEEITKYVDGLSQNIGEITFGMGDISDAKNVTKEAVESITEVLEQTAATASQVQTAALNQVNASEELNKESDFLAGQSKELEESISKFIIS